jgi:uncharacterized protein (DUF952 family)
VSEPRITFHLTPLAVWSARRGGPTYEPEAFALEGFIHCTNGEERVIEVGNRYYAGDPRPYCLLSLERGRLTAPVLYVDPERAYPHVYGPLILDAVVDVRQVVRDEDGSFLGFGESLPNP